MLRGPGIRAVWEQSLRVGCRLWQLLGHRPLCRRLCGGMGSGGHWGHISVSHGRFSNYSHHQSPSGPSVCPLTRGASLRWRRVPASLSAGAPCSERLWTEAWASEAL